MVENLYVFNFSQEIPFPHTACLDFFVLHTCQRILVIYFGNPGHLLLGRENNLYCGLKAYTYVLEILCGLHSINQGETEIVGQFKQVYKKYLNNINRNSRLIRILEKLLMDQKKVRSVYLNKIRLGSYASVAFRLCKEYEIMHEKKLIIGGGNLAKDLIHQFKDEGKLYVSTRKKEVALHLCEQYNVNFIPWMNYKSYLEFSTIICAFGSEHIYFENNFLSKYLNKSSGENIFIDYGRPSSVQSNLSVIQGLFRLQEIFEMLSQHGQENRCRVKKAFEFIKELSSKRRGLFNDKFHKNTILRYD